VSCCVHWGEGLYLRIHCQHGIVSFYIAQSAFSVNFLFYYFCFFFTTTPLLFVNLYSCISINIQKWIHVCMTYYQEVKPAIRTWSGLFLMNYSEYEDSLPDVMCHPLYSSPCDFRQQPLWLYHCWKHWLMFSVWNYTSVAFDVMKFFPFVAAQVSDKGKSQCASEGITSFVGELCEGPGTHWHDSALFLSPSRWQTDFLAIHCIQVLLQNAVTCSCEDCKFINHFSFPLETECPHWAHNFYLSKNCSTYKGTVNSYVLCECSVTFQWKYSGVSSIRDVPRQGH
jgi:hypothetical protein